MKPLTLSKLIINAVEMGITTGVLRRRPTKIFLCCHFAIADIWTLADRADVSLQLDYCRKTFVTFGDPIVIEYYDRNRNEHSVQVILRDSYLMAPAGRQSLKAIGDLLQIPKIDIGERITRMDELLREDPELFRKYAITDAVIAARYMKRMAEFSSDLFNQLEPPPTIGSCAINLTLKIWKDHGIDRHRVLGTEEIIVGSGRRTHKETVPLDVRTDFEEIASKAFAGGRNETYWFGISPEGDYIDWDLRGAYSTALAAIGMPVWEQLRHSSKSEDFARDVIGFACVDFEFPEETRFPCFAVRVKSGLIFPLKGRECYTTAQEIDLARRMGARIKIRRGCVMPMDFGCYPFARVTQTATKLRTEFQERDGKGGLMDLLLKTTANSVYGKTAQAIKPKRLFSTRTRAMEDLKPSKLTNPYIAATVTGIIRTVLGEILWKLPARVRVVSATTDGFLSDLSEALVDTVCSGPACTMFSDARQRIGENRQVLEVKHRAQQVMSWRTRGQATLLYDDPKELILAKAGIQLPFISLPEQNEVIVKKFFGRTYGEISTKKEFTKIRQLIDGADFVKVKMPIEYSMDFDWKRTATDPHEREIGGIPHVCFSTNPLKDEEQFTKLRSAWKNFYHRFKQPLKRAVDLQDFLEFAAIRESGKMHLPRTESALYVARKMFLVAYTHSQWGLRSEIANVELAALLNSCGFETTVHEVENARRKTAALYEHCVEATPSVLRFLGWVVARFPFFDASRLLA
ncbi:MAG TPA: DNA polymerase [Chthoniobacterales bacterium]|jgi:hypothetical protein|nr:DNA polymerase [Chthoniobacterales bacterium]